MIYPDYVVNESWAHAEKGVPQKTTYIGDLQLPEDTVQPNYQQGKRPRQRSFIRANQQPMLSSEPRSSRKHRKI